MILELDCGNSFIKWRVLDVNKVGASAEGVVGSDVALIETLEALPGLLLTRCRMVSVRAPEETNKLIAALEEAFGVTVCCAVSSREMAGVRNGYEDFERLGLDRWLAMLGGFKLAAGPCLVLDFGTAATADFIAADGEHLGGFICPGMPLMRNQLRTHTRKIRYDDAAAERALERLSPGRTTVEAVERGCTLMIRGFVLTQLELARAYWGDDFTVFLTGGGCRPGLGCRAAGSTRSGPGVCRPCNGMSFILRCLCVGCFCYCSYSMLSITSGISRRLLCAQRMSRL